MRGRGLKRLLPAIGQRQTVAPHAGRGLKLGDEAFLAGHEVAPHAGAWIETSYAQWLTSSTKTSPPMRGRGLKPAERAHHRLRR